jgi:hypothetical protein
MSGFKADRESVALLRVSAALIDDQAVDPGWGVVHSLAELIERLVSGSGKPAEYFAKGEPPSLAVSACPACGEWAGQHESWCSHAHEGQAEAAEPAASLESLLAWLDLSGLPPVPPARKPTNWRFDGPEGSEQIPL